LNATGSNALTGTAVTTGSPNFAAAGLINNGGPTETIALTTASTLALGQAATGTGITTDQRGLPRKTVPDIGAFETQPLAPTVKVTANNSTYNGSAYTVSGVTVVGQNTTTLASLTVDPSTLSSTWYVGTGTSGTNLGSNAPKDAGTYTVVVHYTS